MRERRASRTVLLDAAADGARDRQLQTRQRAPLISSRRIDTTPPPTRIRLIRPFTSRFINPITRRFAHRVPGFCILSYRGRKSGTTYRIPMNVFRDGEDYIFALTYGHDVQWVKNVLASGEAEIRIGDTVIPLIDPHLFTDPQQRLMPPVVRFFLRLQRVHCFLRMRPRAAPRAGRPTAG